MIETSDLKNCRKHGVQDKQLHAQDNLNNEKKKDRKRKISAKKKDRF
jgi:hypothetical protein